MNEQRSKTHEGKAKLGRALLWVGSLVLLGESWLLIERVSEFWRSSGAATLGWLAALGALTQRALSIFVWNQGLLLAAMAKVLILCCPLLAIAVGLGMVRQSNLLEASESSGEISPAKEERR